VDGIDWKRFPHAEMAKRGWIVRLPARLYSRATSRTRLATGRLIAATASG
jgi:hypothetical protein